MAWCAGARRLQDRGLARAPLEPTHAAVRGARVFERLAAVRHADVAAGVAASRGRQLARDRALQSHGVALHVEVSLGAAARSLPASVPRAPAWLGAVHPD